MDNLCLEYGYTSINHIGEELCGDKVEIQRNNDYTTLVLADGLGSGVKANILSTLTSKILCTMISNDIAIEDCIETILQSLPVCKVRAVAYSTFTIIHINNQGQGYLFEFDNPETILIKNGVCQDLERHMYTILGKKVYKSQISLNDLDTVVMMSDGVIHAGVGETLNFGWERDNVKDFLNASVDNSMSASSIACMLASACNDLYLNRAGDDTTVAVVKFRKELKVNIMIGPPVEKDKDDFYVERFLSDSDKLVVCGGTSSTIVARYLNKEIKSSIDFPDIDVPPIGYIDGVDLTTEGVLTLRKLVKLLNNYISHQDLSPKIYKALDGASLLADMLFEKATHIHFFVGQSINSAHLGLPIDITMKLKLVEQISNKLRSIGKEIQVDYY